MFGAEMGKVYSMGPVLPRSRIPTDSVPSTFGKQSLKTRDNEVGKMDTEALSGILIAAEAGTVLLLSPSRFQVTWT